MNYIQEMSETVENFFNYLDTVLENNEDIDVNSINEINELIKQYNFNEEEYESKNKEDRRDS